MEYDKIDITLLYSKDGVKITLEGDSLYLYNFAKRLDEKADKDSITESNANDMRLIKFTHTKPSMVLEK